MRPLLLLLPVMAMFVMGTPGQAPHKTAALAVPNFKESGSAAAPITLELYTDYQCPSCRAFYLDVLPSVISQYVSTGKVRLVHRDYPLPMHAYSRLAARYANAGGEVGRYDIVAAQIFKALPEWVQNGNVDDEVAKVVPPGHMQKIREIVKTDAHLDDTVNADMAMGTSDHLTQLPTLVIVKRGQRQKIDGLVPCAIFKSYLDQLLAKG